MSRRIKPREFYSKPLKSAEKEAVESREAGHEYVNAFSDAEFLVREELRPVRLQLELLRPELILQDHQIDETLVFFGSARTPQPEAAQAHLHKIEQALAKTPTDKILKKQLKRARCILANSHYLQVAEDLAYQFSKSTKYHFVVVTGGGPGIMEAANKGAYRANAPSIALSITVPHENAPNPYVTPDLTFSFHYFAIRKMHFLIRAKALLGFPGGFGTLDELFEVLALIQTTKIERIPLILFHEKFWRHIINFEALVEEGVISEIDLDLIQYAETAEEGWELIEDFYAGK